MDNPGEVKAIEQRFEEPVAVPARLLTLDEVAELLGINAEKLRELARRGELPAHLQVGRLLVEAVAPPETEPEHLVAGTTRYKARMAQRVALDHFLERLFDPVVPQRSV